MIKLKQGRLAPILAVISAVVILLGVILYGVLGFNTSLDGDQKHTVEVKYDVVLEVNDKEADLERMCEAVLKDHGYERKETHKVIAPSSLTETTDSILVYTFPAGTDVEKLELSVGVLRSTLASLAEDYQNAKIEVSIHALTSERFTEPAWRGAIAIAVGVIVALVYLAVRYGIDMGVAGLVCAAHDALFTLSILAICRIPVLSFTPVLYAAFAAVISVALWTYYCIRTKRAVKSAENALLPRDMVYRKSLADSKMSILWLGVPLACLTIWSCAGALGTAVSSPAAFGLAMLPFIFAAAVPFYSVLLLGVEVCAPIRRAMEKRKANKKVRYIGKKKAETTK